MHGDEIHSALPGPDGREPPMLRRDIADELDDHLRCAVRRELRGTDDPSTAERAALDQFGNPAAVARKLYFDAMKEAFMKDRILITVVALLSIICLASVALSWTALAVLREKLDQLGQAAAPAQDLDWTYAEVRVSGDTPAQVSLTGNAINTDESVTLTETADDVDPAKFGPIRPGRYSLIVRGEEYIWGEQLVILPGRTFERVIVSPPPSKPARLALTIDWPKELRDKNLYAQVTIQRHAPEDPGDHWRFPASDVLNRFAGVELNRFAGVKTSNFQSVLIAPDGKVLAGQLDASNVGDGASATGSPGAPRGRVGRPRALPGGGPGGFGGPGLGRAGTFGLSRFIARDPNPIVALDIPSGDYSILELVILREAEPKESSEKLFTELVRTMPASARVDFWPGTPPQPEARFTVKPGVENTWAIQLDTATVQQVHSALVDTPPHP